ncbi:MAG: 1-acyl-sn-glycerol-3-phosphate acyltransferase [Balneolaceae bacterium]|nr:1-acyl-sn-glycerol-3-phosphate acyltransferase [Balneolaceae bacterium]
MRKTIIPTTKYLFNPRITNPHNMPLTGPCFIYGNHSNYFDPFMLNVGLTKEPTAGVMTRDQFHKTLPRIFMDSIGIVPTSKYVPEPGIIRSVIRMIDQRRMIVIFPEGGRRWDGKPKPLIETTLKLFWKMGIPVHPVQIHGSHLHWPRWADKYRKGSVEMRFMDPVHASDFNDYDTFADHCRQLISFDEYNPPEGAYPVSCSKPASGIQRLLYRCPETGVDGAIFSPDGEYVFSRAASFRYKMNVASRLVDKNGNLISVVDLFEKINTMPMVSVRYKEGILLEKHGSQIYMIDKEHQLVKLNRSIVELHTDRLMIYMGSETFNLPLEDIRYISVEQNHKITVTTPDLTLQIDLAGKSALQWQLYINRLKKGEKPVASL